MRHRSVSKYPSRISRRAVCAGLAVSTLGAPAFGQSAAAPAASAAGFDYGDVLEAARKLAAAPYQPPPAPIGPTLDEAAYNAVRFRANRAFLAGAGSKFRLELSASGGAGTTPVAVNVVSGGVARALPFSLDLFDFGPRATAARRAAVNGFAGLRLLYPLNAPNVFDETIAFLRGSSFRFVGRGQRLGQFMRGLAIGAGDPGRTPETPRFREFWIIEPAPDADSIELMALLDSPSLAGAFHMTVRPGRDTVVETSARAFARTAVDGLGLAPIASMYFTGESGPRLADDFRFEAHDASGLLTQSKSDEWTWRPLRNPAASAVSEFAGPAAGFGLIQRLRELADYEDLANDYQLRPSYWAEPLTGFDKGALELVELPTDSAAGENIVAQWRLQAGLAAGEGHSWSVRVSTRTGNPDMYARALAAHTLIARPGPNMEGAPPGAQRFFIDFAGAALAPFLRQPQDLTLVAQAVGGRATASIAAHPESPKLRVTLDVAPDKDTGAVASFHLAWLGRPVSETWTFPVEG